MFEMILGIIMIYTWVHGSIIVSKRIEGVTAYENGVLIVGLVSLVLLVLGTIVS